MNTRSIPLGERTLVEILSPEVLIRTPRDALEIIANAGSDYVALHEHNFDAGCFDLSTRRLGEILQKFDNYGVKVAVVGKFEHYPSKALRALIYESNRQRHFLFVPSIDEAMKLWQ
jgi:hypothetical protein